MTGRHIGTCLCGVHLVPSRAWEEAAPAVRQRLRETGHKEHRGRGLCTTCHFRLTRSGDLIDIERRTVPMADVLDAWENDGHRASDSEYVRIRKLAPRLGMTIKALERAIYRAKRAQEVA